MSTSRLHWSPSANEYDKTLSQVLILTGRESPEKQAGSSDLIAHKQGGSMKVTAHSFTGHCSPLHCTLSSTGHCSPSVSWGNEHHKASPFFLPKKYSNLDTFEPVLLKMQPPAHTEPPSP